MKVRAAKNDFPDEPYSSFHPAFFVCRAQPLQGAARNDSLRRSLQERRMEADRVATSFEHHTLPDCRRVAREVPPKALNAARAWPRRKLSISGIRKEAQKDLPRVAEHHNKRHQEPPRAANLETTEVSPVHLALFAGQAAQTQIGFGPAARPVIRRPDGGSDRDGLDNAIRRTIPYSRLAVSAGNVSSV